MKGDAPATVERHSPMKTNGTPVYTRTHKRGLTLPQISAIDLLVSGKNDTETAELLRLSRTCITKWRLYDPIFQAALNRRRQEVWGSGIDRLRSLIPKALDALTDEVEKNPILRTASRRLPKSSAWPSCPPMRWAIWPTSLAQAERTGPFTFSQSQIGAFRS
jgi:hypothetical protein